MPDRSIGARLSQYRFTGNPCVRLLEAFVDLDQTFWSGKRVCVTGGTGLLGYQIVKRLLQVGAEIRVFALASSRPHPLDAEPKVKLFLGDIRDPHLVRAAVEDCEVIFHLAGSSPSGACAPTGAGRPRHGHHERDRGSPSQFADRSYLQRRDRRCLARHSSDK